MTDTAENITQNDPGLPPPRRSWARSVVLGTVLLLCGTVIGSGLTLVALKRRADEFRARPDLLSTRMLERMQADLDLTAKQKVEIEKIFADARKDASEARRRNQAQAQAFFREFQNKVAQVLTPSQQKEWEDWFRKARERAMRNRPGGPPGDHGEKKGDRTNRGFREPATPSDAEAPLAPPPQGIPERHFAPDPSAPDGESTPPPAP